MEWLLFYIVNNRKKKNKYKKKSDLTLSASNQLYFWLVKSDWIRLSGLLSAIRMNFPIVYIYLKANTYWDSTSRLDGDLVILTYYSFSYFEVFFSDSFVLIKPWNKLWFLSLVYIWIVCSVQSHENLQCIQISLFKEQTGIKHILYLWYRHSRTSTVYFVFKHCFRN